MITHQLRALRKPKTLADKRNRQIALAAATSAISRVSGLLLAYVSVSVSIGKLGPATFGLWVTINSLSALLPFADFGLGNGLITFVSSRIGRGHVGQIRTGISSSLYLAAGLGTAIALVGAAFVHSPLLRRILSNQDAHVIGQIVPATTVFCLCLGLTLPASIVEKVQMAGQDSFISNLWQIFTNLATSVGLCLIATHDCQLYDLVLVYSGLPVLTKMLNFVWYFYRTRPEFQPDLRHPDWQTGRHLIKCGTSFVILQSSVAIGYTCDTLIIASQLGALAVAEYNVVQRLFSLTVLAELSIAPLWGAFGEALARGDIEWVRTTFARSTRVNGTVAFGLSALLFLTGHALIQRWTKGTVHPGWVLLWAFALWRSLNVLQANLSVLLNHESTLRKQTVFFSLAALAAFGLKFPLLHLLGPGGVVVATVLAFGTVYAVPSFRLAARLLNPLNQPCERGELVSI